MRDRYHCYGIPYVAGVAQGKLHRKTQGVTSDDILVVTQNQLRLLHDNKPAGLIVIDGAPYTHAMIQFMGLGIPTVIIDAHEAKQLPHNAHVSLNGVTGEIKQIKSVLQQVQIRPTPPPLGKPITTTAGIDINLLTSVSSVQAAERAIKFGAAGVGLVRTEFLLPTHKHVPDTAFYTKALTELCSAASPLPVNIRLLDLAPDKQPAWLPKLTGMQGPLGLQGARLYHSEPIQQVVYSQLAAIDRLTSQFQLKFIIPYITSVKEFIHWRDTFQQLVTAPIEIGAMLETPAAVLEINNYLEIADFVSIGSNDLAQCMYAADRDIPELRHYLNPYAPGLYRILHQAANDAGERLSKVQICGLFPQWPGVLPLLIAMGYSNFSVEPTRIPYLAQIIKDTNIEKTSRIIEPVCNATNAKTVCKLLGVKLPPIWEDE